VPKWVGDRMTRIGAVLCEAIVHHYGRDELLRRLANPFWFQSFGAVMGMDWHSSGITTSVIGALTVWENVTLGERTRLDERRSVRHVTEIAERYGDARRTRIVDAKPESLVEQMVAQEEVVVAAAVAAKGTGVSGHVYGVSRHEL
jgi:hypothetical protein